MTKTEARRIAQRARAYGYHHTKAAPDNPATLYVFCPLCRERVVAPYSALERIISQLDRAMLGHLDECRMALGEGGEDG